MEQAKIEKEIKRLEKLTQYQDKDYHFFKRKAIENLKRRELTSEFVFTDVEEKKLARNLFTKYIDDNSFENISDLNNLKNLVYNEILLTRLQKNLNLATQNGVIPEKSISAVIGLQKQVMEQKRVLGLSSEDTDKSDAFKALETLFAKFYKYQEEHPDEFIGKCPCCQKIIMWNRRVKGYDAKQHPLIRENRPWNQAIIKALKTNEPMTPELAAKILDSSVDYIKEDLLKREISEE